MDPKRIERTDPGKTPGSAEGEEEPRRREVDPGKTPGKAEGGDVAPAGRIAGEEFGDPGTSREHPDEYPRP